MRGVAGREVRLIDYHEESGAGLDHYARVLDEKREAHGWRYGSGADASPHAQHWFPHDVEVNELSSGVSRAATLRTLGITPTDVWLLTQAGYHAHGCLRMSGYRG